MLLVNELYELITCYTAAGYSYQNPVEHVHVIANLGLQSVGMMTNKKSTEMHQLIKKNYSNQELRKATKCHEGLAEALDESHSVPTDLLKSVFSQLSLKCEKFKIFEPASAEVLARYKLSDEIFDKNIADLEKKDSLNAQYFQNSYIHTA